MMAADAAPLAFDPLVAEAKERARRRRVLALGALVVVAAAAVGTTYGLRSPANSRGICATVPSGWKERTLIDPSIGLPAVVLTNFRFGRMDYVYGLTDRFNWPANGVTVAVSNGPVPGWAPPIPPGRLHVRRGDFSGIVGSIQPAAQIAVSSNGRNLTGFVEVGALTPATIAAANAALSGVRTCSA